MAGRERIAALKRARERQRRIEEQVIRTVRSYAAAERARAARAHAIERADQRVAVATGRVIRETALLVEVCGSAEAAAEILDVDIRQVRRAASAVADTPSETRRE